MIISWYFLYNHLFSSNTIFITIEWKPYDKISKNCLPTHERFIHAEQKLLTQLVNGSISVWIWCVWQSIWDILLNYSQRIFAHFLPERPYNVMRNRYRSNFWSRGKLLLLRNATKHNSTKFSAARCHVSSDKCWNCLKDLKCNNVKILVCRWTSGRYSRLNKRKIFVKHFIA